MTHEVYVHGERCHVTTRREGKTWHATGTYRGEFIEGQGARTEELSLKNWESRAKYSDPTD